MACNYNIFITAHKLRQKECSLMCYRYEIEQKKCHFKYYSLNVAPFMALTLDVNMQTKRFCEYIAGLLNKALHVFYLMTPQ